MQNISGVQSFHVSWAGDEAAFLLSGRHNSPHGKTVSTSGQHLSVQILNVRGASGPTAIGRCPCSLALLFHATRRAVQAGMMRRGPFDVEKATDLTVQEQAGLRLTPIPGCSMLRSSKSPWSLPMPASVPGRGTRDGSKVNPDHPSLCAVIAITANRVPSEITHAVSIGGRGDLRARGKGMGGRA